MDIEVDQACIGMALSQDVSEPDGKVLLESGASLTTLHLKLIHAHGIERIRIAAPGRPGENAETQQTGTEKLFRNQDRKHPLVQELTRSHQARQPRTMEHD